VNTIYLDTLQLGPGCYKLVVEDQGCDGLYWWANPNAGSGTIQVRRLNSSFTIPLSGYFNRDFGCGFSQYFTTAWPTDVPNVYSANQSAAIEAVPNPASGLVTVNLSGVSISGGVISIIDAMGRIVQELTCTSVNQTINVSQLSNGVYTIIYADAKGKLQTRLLIAR
ncbi:MAG: T9SS type A sorting domain-containing protein, partial [Sphingobacteriales bacterium]